MSKSLTQSSLFTRLPFEIRLMIYELLLFPSKAPHSAHNISITNLLPDYHTYSASNIDMDAFTLAVRTIDPYLGGTQF